MHTHTLHSHANRQEIEETRRDFNVNGRQSTNDTQAKTKCSVRIIITTIVG
jgi:hypothetical protein